MYFIHKKASAKQLEGQYTNGEQKIHGVAFSAVVAFIEESLNNADEETPVLKLSDLVKMYVDNLEKMGLHLETGVHSTRFKIRLLSQFPDLTASNSKKEVILAFNFDIGEEISIAAKTDFDDDSYILAKAANILHRKVDYHPKNLLTFSCVYKIF